MRKREIDAVAAVLADSENCHRTAEEMAETVIAALDEDRARTHRLAVVGQITYGSLESPRNRRLVVLGPFSSRGVLDSEEKFIRAAQGGSAALTAGYGLAWDTRNQRGRGRFQLAPAFMRPQDAWRFFEDDQDLPEPGPVLEFARRARKRPLWGVTCSCGLEGELMCRWCGTALGRYCALHDHQLPPHQCAA